MQLSDIKSPTGKKLYTNYFSIGFSYDAPVTLASDFIGEMHTENPAGPTTGKHINQLKRHSSIQVDNSTFSRLVSLIQNPYFMVHAMNDNTSRFFNLFKTEDAIEQLTDLLAAMSLYHMEFTLNSHTLEKFITLYQKKAASDWPVTIWINAVVSTKNRISINILYQPQKTPNPFTYAANDNKSFTDFNTFNELLTLHPELFIAAPKN